MKNLFNQFELRAFFENAFSLLKNREVKLPDSESKKKYSSIPLYRHYHHFLNTFTTILRLVSNNSAKAGESAKKIAQASEKLGVDSSDIENSMKIFLEEITNLTSEIHSITSEVSEIRFQSNQMLERNNNILDASLEIESKVESGIKEMKAGVFLISELVDQNKELSQTIKELWSRYTFLVNHTQELIKIAERTKMLALNAEIESAHAGEFGKGFSVVAREMGNLSQMNSEYARNIYKGIIEMREQAQLTEINVSSSVELAQNAESEIEKAHQNYLQVGGSIKDVLKDSKEFSLSFSNLELSLRMMGQHISETNALIKGSNQKAGEIFHSVKSQRFSIEEMSQEISTSFHVSRTLNSLISQYDIFQFHSLSNRRTQLEQLIQGILNMRGIYVYVLYSDIGGIPDYVFSENEKIDIEINSILNSIEPLFLQKEELDLFFKFKETWFQYRSLGQNAVQMIRNGQRSEAKALYEGKGKVQIKEALSYLLDMLDFE